MLHIYIYIYIYDISRLRVNSPRRFFQILECDDDNDDSDDDDHNNNNYNNIQSKMHFVRQATNPLLYVIQGKREINLTNE